MRPYEIVCSIDDRAVWLEARRHLVGASDKLNNSTLKKKISPSEESGNKYTFIGSMLEEPIRRMFSVWTGMRSRRGRHLIRSKQYPFIGATVDGVCRMPTTERGVDKMRRHLVNDMGLDEWEAEEMIRYKNLSVLEIKAPVGRKLPLWAETETSQYYLTKKPYEKFIKRGEYPPRDYYQQVQQQLLVTGMDVAWLVALVGGEHIISYRIESNKEAQRKRILQCEQFWAKVERARKNVNNG